jgi:hypothetical protein
MTKHINKFLKKTYLSGELQILIISEQGIANPLQRSVIIRLEIYLVEGSMRVA